MNENLNNNKKEQRNYFILTSESIMKSQWNQPKKFSNPWNTK